MLTAVLEHPKNNFKSELRTAEDSLQRRKQNPFCRHLGPTTALDAATDFNNHMRQCYINVMQRAMHTSLALTDM